MALGEITDPKAVAAAIAEFDEVGRDAFLKKYGFSRARSYFLYSQGRRYDSKAIVGVARGYQYPAAGPLSAKEFSGGETAAVRVLRKLGFEVLRLGSRSRAPRSWAFCANPNRYRIADAVRHLDIDLWNVGRSDVRAGDQALLWQTLDHAGNRGIVGLGTILGDPEPQADTGNPYWTSSDDGADIIPRVPVHYDVPGPFPLWADSEHKDFLLGLSVARAQGGTVFKVTSEQWQHLISVIGGWRPAPVEEAEATRKVRLSKPGRSQGFGLSTAERRAVEHRAMELARWHFQANWPAVEDVSSRCSYDLLCQNGEEDLRVEVKGTTTAGEAVILTKNEVRTAREPGYALFVVSGIELSRGKKVSATGGQCRVFDPWDIESAGLIPIQYRCELDISAGKVVSPQPSVG